MRKPSLKPRQRGNAMLEFAIGAGVMISCFFGVFQFGYTFYQYNLLETAVNDGARYASMLTYDAACSSVNGSSQTPSTTFSNYVKNEVVYADPTGSTTTPIANSLGTSNVTLTVSCNDSSGNYTGVPTFVTVAITGYTINSIFSTVTLTGKPSATYPYIGFYAPY